MIKVSIVENTTCIEIGELKSSTTSPKRHGEMILEIIGLKNNPNRKNIYHKIKHASAMINIKEVLQDLITLKHVVKMPTMDFLIEFPDGEKKMVPCKVLAFKGRSEGCEIRLLVFESPMTLSEPN